MPKLSSAAWIAHDLGLAAAIGGTLFGKVAFDPSLKQIKNPKWRDKVNDDAWHRYGPLTLGAHLAIAAPWLVGRLMLSGKEVSSNARQLTKLKDVLIGVSVVSVVASAILGRIMNKRKVSAKGPEQARTDDASGDDRKQVTIDYTLDAVSMLNLAANVGVMGVTALLAMEGAESKKFEDDARDLP
jgi:hypothetical protein